MIIVECAFCGEVLLQKQSAIRDRGDVFVLLDHIKYLPVEDSKYVCDECQEKKTKEEDK